MGTRHEGSGFPRLNGDQDLNMILVKSLNQSQTFRQEISH